MVNWKFFVGGCILSCGLLLKMGAPLPAVAAGMCAVALLNWRRQRHSR